MRILAAVDASAVAPAIMSVARAFADRLDAQLVALHARGDGDLTAPPRIAEIAATSGAELTVEGGDVVATIVEAASAEDVVATVIGARGEPGGKVPAGHTALAIASAIHRPVVVTPPATATTEVRRVLLPLEGPAERPGDGLLARLVDRGVQLVPLHVFVPSTVPAFWDQPHHAASAWSSGFVLRHAPTGAKQLWLRSGDVPDAVLDVVARAAVDVVALRWSENLREAHAPIVRAVLAWSPVPVLLLPVTVPPGR